MAENEKIENIVHEQIWDAANATLRLERAVSEARDLCYVVLGRFDNEDDSLPYGARYWLDTFGTDSRKEINLEAVRRGRVSLANPTGLRRPDSPT